MTYYAAVCQQEPGGYLWFGDLAGQERWIKTHTECQGHTVVPMLVKDENGKTYVRQDIGAAVMLGEQAIPTGVWTEVLTSEPPRRIDFTSEPGRHVAQLRHGPTGLEVIVTDHVGDVIRDGIVHITTSDGIGDVLDMLAREFPDETALWLAQRNPQPDPRYRPGGLQGSRPEQCPTCESPDIWARRRFVSGLCDDPWHDLEGDTGKLLDKLRNKGGGQIDAVVSGLTLDAIRAEAIRAHAKHGAHSMRNPRVPAGERLAILVEEVGEVAKALTYDQSRDDLERELIQVGAMAAAWIEALNDPMRPAPYGAPDGWSPDGEGTEL
jgi:hypothetical protein